jgi:hypothetical protein
MEGNEYCHSAHLIGLKKMEAIRSELRSPIVISLDVYELGTGLC